MTLCQPVLGVRFFETQCRKLFNNYSSSKLKMIQFFGGLTLYDNNTKSKCYTQQQTILNVALVLSLPTDN